MSLRPIIIVPDPVLRTVSQPVADVDAAVRAQMDDMLETMYSAQGIGLAANQIGETNRIFVMDIADPEGARDPRCFANPEIIFRSEERSSMEEGCLSIPGHVALVERPAHVRVRYLDYHGHITECEASGLMAHCVQHEIDHLDGVLCIDYLSRLKRDMIIRKVRKAQKDEGGKRL